MALRLRYQLCGRRKRSLRARLETCEAPFALGAALFTDWRRRAKAAEDCGHPEDGGDRVRAQP
eukprot:6315035-Prymnesium_polylepis.1